ncbi:MAG: dockerin type I domain-containing protein [Phycisphaerales bacterium]
MRLSGAGTFAGGIAATLACSAAADFTVDLGSGPLVGNETRFVEIMVDETMIPSGTVMVGFEFSMDYVAGAGAEWASDLGFWINDANGNPSVQIGGFDILFADLQGAVWGFDGAGSAASGTYTDAQDLLHSGTGMWRFSIGNGWTGGGAVEYNNVTINVIVGEIGVCGDAEGSCAEVHPTPGCNDTTCCQTVCDFEPFCCDVEWDDFCVASAVKLCGIYQYECPAGGPANNCPTNATVVEDGDAVAFDTTNATQVAPDGCEDYDPPLGPDVWYQFTAPSGGTLIASTCDAADYDNKSRGYNIGDGNFDPNTLPDLLVACNDDGAGCSGFTSVLTMSVEANTTYLVAIGGFQFATGSGTVTFDFVPDAAACGEPGAGSCCDPQPGPFCAEGDCCESVCAIDPACCDSIWDANCANLAFQTCAPLCGEVIPPQECTNPGANPVDTTAFVGTGGVACAAGGITTPNTYAIVFTQADIGSAYSFNCVNFGLDNSGSYLEGDISVWIDENGGDPSINDVTLVASYPVGLYNGDDQQVTVTGDLQCIELTGDQTLVVTLSIPQATDGFTTFAGAATGFTTYILSDACGIGDFITLDSIGFPDNKWWVELSGNDGCDGGGIPGDLNADGVVNGADLTILAAAWGTADPIADLDGNGTVDGADLSILLSNWSA